MQGSSNIPLAREYLRDGLLSPDHDTLRKAVRTALSLMTRQSPERRAPTKNKPLTPAQKERARFLKKKYPNKTLHEIANMMGVGNIGRMSEAR